MILPKVRDPRFVTIRRGDDCSALIGDSADEAGGPAALSSAADNARGGVSA
jgi:hypothetical protein